MKKKKTKERNPFAVLAKKRKGGVHKKKTDRRKNGKNPMTEFLKDS